MRSTEATHGASCKRSGSVWHCPWREGYGPGDPLNGAGALGESLARAKRGSASPNHRFDWLRQCPPSGPPSPRSEHSDSTAPVAKRISLLGGGAVVPIQAPLLLMRPAGARRILLGHVCSRPHFVNPLSDTSDCLRSEAWSPCSRHATATWNRTEAGDPNHPLKAWVRPRL